MSDKGIKKRIEWIDTLRGLAMFFVLWGHCFPSNKGIVREYIYSFHMPLFFFISGLTYKENPNSNFKEFLKKMCEKLIIPYIFINLFCLAISAIMYYMGYYESFEIVDLILGLFVSHTELYPSAAGPTWFLLTLFLTEILFYFLKKISNDDKSLFTNVMICGVIGYLTSIWPKEQMAPWHFNTVFTAVVFYFVGYIFIKHIDKFKDILSSNKKKFGYGFVLGLIGGYTCFENSRVSLHANNYGDIVLFYISALSTIFGLVLFVNLFLKKSILFKKVGTYTLAYLGYHNFIIRILRHYFENFNDNDITILIGGICTFLIMFPIAWVIYKYVPILVGKFNNKQRKLSIQ